MAVRNHRKAAEARGQTWNGPTRKVIIGDPAAGKVEHNPKASTKRGQRRNGQVFTHKVTQPDEDGNLVTVDEPLPTYKENQKTRSRQSHPCSGTSPVHKGPHQQPKKEVLAPKAFREMMEKREHFGPDLGGEAYR